MEILGRSVAFERPFYSPYAKWAAGISFASQVKKDSLKNLSPLYVPLNLKFRTQDFWAAKAIQIFKGSTEDELATNLIFAIALPACQVSVKNHLILTTRCKFIPVRIFTWQELEFPPVNMFRIHIFLNMAQSKMSRSERLLS